MPGTNELSAPPGGAEESYEDRSGRVRPGGVVLGVLCVRRSRICAGAIPERRVARRSVARSRRVGRGARTLCALAIVVSAGLAREGLARQESDGPETSPALKQLLDASYLSEDERRELRVRHGLWEKSDLNSPALAARAAMMRGAYDDPSLMDPAASLEDRAEAMLRRGDGPGAAAALAESTSMRARRVRAEALLSLGRFEDAKKELDEVHRVLNEVELKNAAELVEGVLALQLRVRLPEVAGEEGRRAQDDFRAMMSMLAKAREKLDRLDPGAPLAEARLLDEKDNTDEALKALQQAISLNPRNAQAWALLGRISVDQFDFARAQKMVEKLDELAGPGSVEGALLAARLRLKQNDAESAELALAPIAEKFPAMEAALALRAAAAAGKYDDVKAAQVMAEFDRLWPGSPLALLETGRVLSQRRQYAAGAERLREAMKRAPGWPEPALELGLLCIQAAWDDEAIAALEKSTALDPFNVRAANCLKLARDVKSFVRYEGEHFVVRCRPGIDEVMGAEMMPALERLYARVTGNGRGGIDYAPPGKTIIELMPDHATFAVRVTGMPQVHTIAASTGPLIAMESPRSGAGSSMGPYDWARVLQHEFTHTVTLARTKNRLPHWFTEAAAVFLEDAPRNYDRCQLLTRTLERDELFDLDEINVAFVRPKRQQDRGLAYAQGHWMYEFMIDRWGPEAPLKLMDRYGAGDNEAAAMQQVLGMSRAQFVDEFKAWAKDQVQQWGMSLPEGVPTLRQLLETEAREAAKDGQAPGELPEPTTEMVNRWLQAYPAHPQVLSVAVSMELLQSAGTANASMIPLLDRYGAARPVDPLPHRLLAKLYLDDPDPMKAVPHLEYMDAREQNNVSFAMELAKRYAAGGRWENATAKAERATQVSPFDPAPRELAATIAIKRGDFETAKRHLTALTKLEPERAVHKQRLEALEKLKSGR